jgi:hypothetical protein
MLSPPPSQHLRPLPRPPTAAGAADSLPCHPSADDPARKVDAKDNPLKNAPHTATELVGEWPHGYARELAVYPLAELRDSKYWPPVGRVDNVYGDRNLACACPPLSSYQDV